MGWLSVGAAFLSLPWCRAHRSPLLDWNRHWLYSHYFVTHHFPDTGPTADCWDKTCRFTLELFVWCWSLLFDLLRSGLPFFIISSHLTFAVPDGCRFPGIPRAICWFLDIHGFFCFSARSIRELWLCFVVCRGLYAHAFVDITGFEALVIVQLDKEPDGITGDVTAGTLSFFFIV